MQSLAEMTKPTLKVSNNNDDYYLDWEQYTEIPPVYEQIFDIVPSSAAYEKFNSAIGLGDLLEKPEGEEKPKGEEDKDTSKKKTDADKVLSNAAGKPDTSIQQDTASAGGKKGNFMNALKSVTTRSKDNPRGNR